MNGRRPLRAAMRPPRSGPRAPPPAGTSRQAPPPIGNQEAQRLLRTIVRGDARVGRRDDPLEHADHAPARPPARATGSSIEQAFGAGRALDADTRARAESRHGVPFADVRLHDGPAATESAAALGTRAFTDGRHIAIAAGAAASPATRDALLDHELGHIARGDAAGGVIRRDPLGPQLPPQVAPVAAGVSFQLPGGKALTGDWNDLSTVNPTTVTITVRTSGIDLQFSPALLVDAQWPVSDMEWGGLHYDFASASVTSIDLTSTQSVAFSAGSGTARSSITSFFTGLLAGSRMASGGYDPLADPDLAGTMDRIRANFVATPSSGGEVTAADVSHVTPFAEVSVRGPIRVGAGEGSVTVDGSVRVSAALQGSAEELGGAASAGRVHIERLTLSSQGIVVHASGQPVARLEEIVVTYGGGVAIERMTLLGRAAELAETEARAREGGFLFLLAVVLSESGPADRLAISQGQLPDLRATIVPGITRERIQQALTQALLQFLRQNSGAIPGLDLTDVFGVGTLGDFPAPRPPAGPGSALG